MIDKVNSTGDASAQELEDAMQKDLAEAVNDLENFVKTVGKPYQDAAPKRLDKFLEIQDGILNVQMNLKNTTKFKFKIFM